MDSITKTLNMYLYGNAIRRLLFWEIDTKGRAYLRGI